MGRKAHEASLSRISITSLHPKFFYTHERCFVFFLKWSTAISAQEGAVRVVCGFEWPNSMKLGLSIYRYRLSRHHMAVLIRSTCCHIRIRFDLSWNRPRRFALYGCPFSERLSGSASNRQRVCGNNYLSSCSDQRPIRVCGQGHYYTP